MKLERVRNYMADKIRGDTGSWETLMQMIKPQAGAKIGLDDYNAQIQTYQGTNFACIHKKATAVASVPMLLYSLKDTENTRTRSIETKARDYLESIDYVRQRVSGVSDANMVEVESHPALDLLHHVNNKMTKHNLFYMTVTWDELCGECYWLVLKNQIGEKKVPASIRFLFPQFVKPVPNPDGSLKSIEYKPGRDKKIYKGEDVIQFWYPGPFSDVHGFSPTIAASYPISAEQNIFRYQDAVFGNGGLPAALAIAKTRLSPTEFRRFKAEFESIYLGLENAGKTALLEGDIEIREVGAAPKDMAFMDGAKLAREFIANIRGVPLSKLTMESSNRAVAREGNIEWWRDTIQPLCLQIGEELTESLVPMYGEGFLFAPKDCVPEDRQLAVLERKANLTVPFSSTNEERAKDKLEPVPGGDIIFRPGTTVPLDSVASEQEISEDYIDDLVGKVMAKATEKLKRYGIRNDRE